MTHSWATWLVYETWLLCKRHDSFVRDMTPLWQTWLLCDSSWHNTEVCLPCEKYEACVGNVTRWWGTWLIYEGRDPFMRGAWLFHKSHFSTRHSICEWVTCGRRDSFMRDVTHSCVVHDSFIWVTCGVTHMWDMTQSYESDMCAMTHPCVAQYSWGLHHIWILLHHTCIAPPVGENSQQMWVLPGESNRYRTRQVVIILVRWT